MSHKIIIHNESFVSGLLKIHDDYHGRVDRHLINISEDEIDMPIFRIFSYDRLESILKNNHLGLVRPKKWDDPFENWLLKSNFVLNDGSESSIMSSHSFVGQCWSATEESDAMWRIYSPDKNGVKIKTTIRKLLHELLTKVDDDSKFEISKFIGKVKYLSKEDIIQEFEINAKEFTTTNIGQAKSHFYKRLEFQHENEVRILFKTSKNVHKDIFNLTISPNNLIDEIILDPRLDNQKVDKISSSIKNLGYNNFINQSQLYKFDNIFLNIDL